MPGRATKPPATSVAVVIAAQTLRRMDMKTGPPRKMSAGTLSPATSLTRKPGTSVAVLPDGAFLDLRKARLANPLHPVLVEDRLVRLVHRAVRTEHQEPVQGPGEPAIMGDRDDGAF